MQAQMLEVVAGIDDDREVMRRKDAIEAERQLGAADSAADGEDVPIRSRRRGGWCAGHRNRSMCFGRMSAAALAGASVHRRARAWRSRGPPAARRTLTG